MDIAFIAFRLIVPRVHCFAWNASAQAQGLGSHRDHISCRSSLRYFSSISGAMWRTTLRHGRGLGSVKGSASSLSGTPLAALANSWPSDTDMPTASPLQTTTPPAHGPRRRKTRRQKTGHPNYTVTPQPTQNPPMTTQTKQEQ